MVLCIGATPAAQRVMCFERLRRNEVNRAAATLDGAAGKAVNVAKVLHTLGARPIVTGFIGGSRGEEVKSVLQGKGIERDFLPVAPPTRQCITVIDQSTASITELVQESHPIADAEYVKLTAHIRRRLPGCRAVVMSGTITPGGPDHFYSDCVRLAREAGTMPVVDAKGRLLTEALKAKPALVKPNRAELATTIGCELPDETAVVSAMRQLAERGAERVVVTAGSQPTLAFDGAKLWQIIPPPIEAINPIGSGDAFTAAVVWRLLLGEHLGEACRWGAAAGAANALSLMPGELTLPDVQRLAAQTQVRLL